jgi:hypothetical protein
VNDQLPDTTRHLASMRALAVTFLLALAGTAALVVVAPRLAAPVSSTLVTVAAVGCALWIAITVDRFARSRLTRIRDAFANHRDAERLLGDHRRVYLAVLVRLSTLAGLAWVIAAWGSGRSLAGALLVLAGLLMLLAWPTEHKARLLLERARLGAEEATAGPLRDESD